MPRPARVIERESPAPNQVDLSAILKRAARDSCLTSSFDSDRPTRVWLLSAPAIVRAGRRRHHGPTSPNGGGAVRPLFMLLTGSGDPTRASIPLHLAANGSVEVGDQPVVVLAGDATEYLPGDAIERTEGVGVPPMRELLAKLRDHEVPVYV